MKNHFIIAYTGNKREEVEIIYNYIKLNDEIEYIIEAFCGSSALSYYISSKNPKKYKYVLNDNDNLLIELYKIIQDDLGFKNFIKKINDMCFINDVFIDKIQYCSILKENNIYSYFIKHKFYNIRPGLYPTSKKSPIIYENVLKTPIINFLRTEEIIFYSEDAISIIEKYDKINNIILLDPPYLNCSANSLYDNANLNIYEYIVDKNFNNTYLIVENNWIIKLICKNKESFIYEKIYNGLRKKKVNHIIIKL